MFGGGDARYHPGEQDDAHDQNRSHRGPREGEHNIGNPDFGLSVG